MLKKMHLIVTTVLFGLALSACQRETPRSTANTTAPASATDAQVVEEVRVVLQKHDKALNDKNLDAVLATFSNDPKTVVLGTGDGERYVGQQAIREAYTEILKDYDSGTLKTDCEWKTGGVDAAGTTAWVAATCKAEDSLKSIKRDYVLNVSGALKKEADGWRFVMLHMSNFTNTAPPVAANIKSTPANWIGEVHE